MTQAGDTVHADNSVWVAQQTRHNKNLYVQVSSADTPATRTLKQLKQFPDFAWLIRHGKNVATVEDITDYSDYFTEYFDNTEPSWNVPADEKAYYQASNPPYDIFNNLIYTSDDFTEGTGDEDFAHDLSSPEQSELCDCAPCECALCSCETCCKACGETGNDASTATQLDMICELLTRISENTEKLVKRQESRDRKRHIEDSHHHSRTHDDATRHIYKKPAPPNFTDHTFFTDNYTTWLNLLKNVTDNTAGATTQGNTATTDKETPPPPPISVAEWFIKNTPPTDLARFFAKLAENVTGQKPSPQAENTTPDNSPDEKEK